MLKDPITLQQLLQYLKSEDEIVQVSDGYDWGIYSEFQASSYLLEPFLDWYVIDLGAIDMNTIRITIRKEKEKSK